MVLGSLHVQTHAVPTTNNPIGMHGYCYFFFIDEETQNRRRSNSTAERSKPSPASPGKYISIGVIEYLFIPASFVVRGT